MSAERPAGPATPPAVESPVARYGSDAGPQPTGIPVTVLAGGYGGAKLSHGLALASAPGRRAARHRSTCPSSSTPATTWSSTASPSRRTWTRSCTRWPASPTTRPAGACATRRGRPRRCCDATARRPGSRWATGTWPPTCAAPSSCATDQRLTEVTAELACQLGVAARLLPMTRRPGAHRAAHARWLAGVPGLLRAARPARHGAARSAGAGIETARPTAEVLAAIAGARLIVIAPSNPFVSVGTILAVPGMLEALLAAPAPVVAVSPVVGGEALRGPADRMLESLGGEASARGVVAHYREQLPGARGRVRARRGRRGGGRGAARRGRERGHPRHGHAQACRPAAARRGDPGGAPARLSGLRGDPTTSSRSMRRATRPAAGRARTWSRIHVVLPLRTVSGGKARLGEALDAEEREELVLGLLLHTLAVLAAWPRCGRIHLVSPDPVLAAPRRQAGADVDRPSPVRRGPQRGHPPSARGGHGRGRRQPAGAARRPAAPFRRGARRARPGRGCRPRGGGGGPLVAIAPSDARSGTNALLLRPPDVIEPAFGSDSFEAHLRAAEAAGAAVQVVSDPALGFDLDTPEDLERLDPPACASSWPPAPSGGRGRRVSEAAGEPVPGLRSRETSRRSAAARAARDRCWPWPCRSSPRCSPGDDLGRLAAEAWWA